MPFNVVCLFFCFLDFESPEEVPQAGDGYGSGKIFLSSMNVSLLRFFVVVEEFNTSEWIGKNILQSVSFSMQRWPSMTNWAYFIIPAEDSWREEGPLPLSLQWSDHLHHAEEEVWITETQLHEPVWVQTRTHVDTSTLYIRPVISNQVCRATLVCRESSNGVPREIIQVHLFGGKLFIHNKWCIFVHLFMPATYSDRKNK